MSKPTANGRSDKLLPAPYDVRVSVERFGPIKKGSVDLRPLTIFVGPSNTGKTYLAILIYALHRTLHGFTRFPSLGRHFFPQEKDCSPTTDELERVLDRMQTDENPIRFSELPASICESAQNFLNVKAFLARDLRIELERCFDLKSVSSLIRMPGQTRGTKLSIAVREGQQELWEFLMGISKSAISSRGNINDMELSSKHNFGSETANRRAGRLRRYLHHIREGGGSENKLPSHLLGDLWDILVPLREIHDDMETYYLPAARSGIMQSHRVIAGSLVARSARGGLERFPELPTFSGVMTDFMQRLIFYDEPSWDTGFRSHRTQRQRKEIEDLADTLERQTLGGQIRASKPSPNAYPEFVFRPLEGEQDINLSRASSMVSELAPVVLFIRSNVCSGDTLIIEEPEAHLHPAGQTEMATTLARLVGLGVRVVVTTHSDWLLKEISNLMREGELEEQAGESANENLSPSSLQPRDVGIWLFHKSGAAQGATIQEIKWDRSEGIEPADYEDVAEQLYNRSAGLQNRFEEVVNQGKT